MPGIASLRGLAQPGFGQFLAAGQLGQGLWVALPGGQGVQHVPPRGTVDVGDHRRQLQVPVPGQPFHPLLFGGAGLGEVTSVPGVDAQHADRLGRHEAGADHPPLGDLGEPDRVGAVGLGPPRQRLDLPALNSSQSKPCDSSRKNTGFQ
jgi:hypothetical protein